MVSAKDARYIHERNELFMAKIQDDGRTTKQQLMFDMGLIAIFDEHLIMAENVMSEPSLKVESRVDGTVRYSIKFSTYPDYMDNKHIQISKSVYDNLYKLKHPWEYISDVYSMDIPFDSGAYDSTVYYDEKIHGPLYRVSYN